MQLFNTFAAYISGMQTYMSISPPDHGARPLSFSQEWRVLGPFQIGTREATWGSDPSAYHGGFNSSEYDPNTTYRSSLAPNATVRWTTVQADSAISNANSAQTSLSVGFREVDFEFLQQVYGWAALQYQAWARGYLYVKGSRSQSITLSIDHVLEFYVNDELYFGGDYYSYRRAPLVSYLQPGSHKSDVRLIRDVRVMGGVGAPTIETTMRAETHSQCSQLSYGKPIIPDLINGHSAGRVGSITVRNHASTDVEVLAVFADVDAVSISLHSAATLEPGQTRPLTSNIGCVGLCATEFSIHIHYRTYGSDDASILSLPYSFEPRSIHDPHKITFLHPSGIASYAILRAPSARAQCSHETGNFPVLLQFHGAGLEAADPMVAHALDPLPDLCAWVLFPTGVTPWSGDDWHAWGFADVEAAIQAIPPWVIENNWQGPGVDVDRWLVSGHSNGGQGTWYALTHRPDKVIAAAPVSGYSSIQNYVPYTFWRPMQSPVRSVLDGGISSYQHELLLENSRGIPIFQQHGGSDDNVPAYHSRLLSQLLHEFEADSTYVELPGAGHWFDGVMTTDHLQAFYQQAFEQSTSLRDTPGNFSLVVANPADTGSKHGFQVLHLRRPGQSGKVQVSFLQSDTQCHIRTTNVLSMKLPANFLKNLEVDSDGQSLEDLSVPSRDAITISRGANGEWKLTEHTGHMQRSGRQLGAMEAILRTHGVFQIVYHNPDAQNTALQISRNLCQYFAADTQLSSNDSTSLSGEGNIMRLSVGSDMALGLHADFPIHVQPHGMISVRDDTGHWSQYNSEEFEGLGAVFLRPLEEERLELISWGAELEGLKMAARLVPMLTGVGQPDFVVTRKDMMWKGADGVLAMGFFDHAWNVSAGSFFT